MDRQAELDALIKAAMDQPGVAEVISFFGAASEASRAYGDAVAVERPVILRNTSDSTASAETSD